jgi:hypothetical protein
MRTASVVFLSGIALALGACSGGVSVGVLCDDTHPCPDGQVCGPDGRCVAEDGGPADAGGDGGDAPGSDACVTACGAGCCSAEEVCLGDVCYTNLGDCTDSGECQSDSHCVDGHCIPYGPGETNPECRRLVVIGLFQPTLHCLWDGTEAGLPYPEHVQVESTPIVVDFDFDGDPATKRPALVFASYNSLDGLCGLGTGNTGSTSFGVLRVVDGKTCKTLYTIDPADGGAKVNGSSTPAVGDLDGDGRPEIVTYSATGGLVAFRYDPGQDKFVTLWVGHEAGGAAHNPAAGQCIWVGPSLADLDDDGVPEAILGGSVYDASGALLDGALGSLHTASRGTFPVLADVDHDGRVELADGLSAYSFEPTTRLWTARPYASCQAGQCTAGLTAVADFGTFGDDPAQDDFTTLDGVAEIAVVGAGWARIQKLDGRVLFRVQLPGSTGGGPPTIGDFDGDGLPELAAAGSDSYTVFDPRCTAAAPDTARCGTPRDATGVGGYVDGVLWSKYSQDHSSNVTGSSIFDFEGNGDAEAIYADECYVRIYRGRDGEVIFSQPRTSCTWHENPIVADVDGSFQSKLIVPSNESCEVSCADIDPSFAGLRCDSAADCPGALPCDEGLCRCTEDAQCGQTAVGGGFFCRDAPAGTPGSGKTCRAGHVITGGAAYGVPVNKIHGVRIYADVLDRWVSSRMIWSQHAYSITHITEAGAVVKTGDWVQNFRTPGLNTFRANTQGDLGPSDSPDATAGGLEWSCDEETFTLHLKVLMCNRGTAPVGADTPLTFYRGDPVVRDLLCTASTTAILQPGECAELACDAPGQLPNVEFDVTAVADDPGTGQPRYAECIGTNNTMVAKGVVCRYIG